MHLYLIVMPFLVVWVSDYSENYLLSFLNFSLLGRCRTAYLVVVVVNDYEMAPLFVPQMIYE